MFFITLAVFSDQILQLASWLTLDIRPRQVTSSSLSWVAMNCGAKCHKIQPASSSDRRKAVVWCGGGVQPPGQECKVRRRKSCHHMSVTQLPDPKKGAALIFMTFLTLPRTPPPLAHRHTLTAPHQLVLSASSLPSILMYKVIPMLKTTNSTIVCLDFTVIL